MISWPPRHRDRNSREYLQFLEANLSKAKLDHKDSLWLLTYFGGPFE